MQPELLYLRRSHFAPIGRKCCRYIEKNIMKPLKHFLKLHIIYIIIRDKCLNVKFQKLIKKFVAIHGLKLEIGKNSTKA